MSRNGSGSMTIPNTMVAGEVITASDHNENYTDIGAEITNSVAVDGQSTMTGPLKAASGTVAAPGIAFGSDLDTGLYRIGSNNLGIAAAGAKVVDVATTGMTVTGDVSATTVKQGGFQLIPPGVMLDYAGASAPSGWLLCYGQNVSRTTYSALFTAIGTTHGAGDGSTTFTLPDCRGRVRAGKDDMGGAAVGLLTATYFGAADGALGTTLGAKGGAQANALVTANLPAYTPAGSVSVGSTTNTLRTSAGSGVAFDSTAGTDDAIAAQAGFTDVGTLTSTGTLTGTAQGGISTPVSKVQPTIIVNTIIYAGV
jgi:microcystin-dependent protein